MGIYDREYVRQERGERRFGGERSMVTNLILVNVAIYILDVLSAGALSSRMMLWSNLPSHPLDFWKLLACGFAHDPHDWLHVFGNMLALWFFGREVEGVYGRREFLRIYLTLIVLCSLFWVAWQQVADSSGGNPTSALGASGAVTGVVILFVLHFPRQTVLLFGALPIPAWVLGVIYLANDLSGLVQRPEPGKPVTAYQVHLAGAALAFAYYASGIRLGQFIPGGLSWSNLSFRRRPRLRVHDPASPSTDLGARVDRLLEKISQHGQESLTDEERRTLEDASRRYQQRRG